MKAGDIMEDEERKENEQQEEGSSVKESIMNIIMLFALFIAFVIFLIFMNSQGNSWLFKSEIKTRPKPSAVEYTTENDMEQLDNSEVEE